MSSTQDSRPAGPLAIIKAGLEKSRAQFKAVLPAQISPEQFQGVVLTAVTSRPDLVMADRRSLFVACSMAAKDGLLPDGREGALVVYRDKQGKNLVQWQIMVDGYLKLMRQGGEIEGVGARLVYANEIDRNRFEYFISKGREHLRHEPMLYGDRGMWMLAYAYARWKSGTVQYLPMHRDDIMRRKKASKAKGEFSPWQQWEEEMALKTVLKALAKRLPLSTQIYRAIERDDEPSEFDRLKNEATQSIEAAASLMGAQGAPRDQIEHENEHDQPTEITDHVDEETGELTSTEYVIREGVETST